MRFKCTAKGIDLNAFKFRESQRYLARTLYSERVRIREGHPCPVFDLAPAALQAAYLDLAKVLLELHELPAHAPHPTAVVTGLRGMIPGRSNVIGMFGALALVLSVVGCDQKVIGTAPTVIADPNAPAGKTRATALQIKSAEPVRGAVCAEDGGGLLVEPVDRQSSWFNNKNTGCTWLAVFPVYGIPPGATDTAQQHWIAGMYQAIGPGQRVLMYAFHKGCRDQWTVKEQTDAWALRKPPAPGDQPLPKQFSQEGVPLHEFGGREWDVDECAGTPTPPCHVNCEQQTSCPADITVNLIPNGGAYPEGYIARFPAWELPFAWLPQSLGPFPVTVPSATWQASLVTYDHEPFDAQDYESVIAHLRHQSGTSEALPPTPDIPEGQTGPLTSPSVTFTVPLGDPITSIVLTPGGEGQPFPNNDATDSVQAQSVTFHCVRPL